MSFLPRLAPAPITEDMTSTSDTDAMEQYLTSLRAFQALARYPALLTGLRSREVIAYQERGGSGLVTVAVEQKMLGEEELEKLGAFRLHQYLLCGWYNLEHILADRVQTDPLLQEAPLTSIHILSGTVDGQILAYCTLQGAIAATPSEAPLLRKQDHLLLTDTHRPLFFSEHEIFDSALFATLPALRTIPLSAIGELNCILRNQAIASPLSTIAVVETLLAMTRYISRPDSGLSAVLGASDMEARRLLAALGFPVLYAPHVPGNVPPPGMLSGLPYIRYLGHSELGESARRKYWPFVVAIEDLRAHAKHFARLDQAFAASRHSLRQALVEFRKEPRIAPAAFVPAPGASALLWTDDPDYH